jgi:hypothetical protein
MMIEGLVLPCTPASLLRSAVNAKVWQLVRWALCRPWEVNRRIELRTRREEQLRAEGSRGDGADRSAVRATAQERPPL